MLPVQRYGVTRQLGVTRPEASVLTGVSLLKGSRSRIQPLFKPALR